MLRSRRMWLVAAAAVLVGGCTPDLSQQLVSNEQVRTQVLATIAGHRELALETVDKLLASDSLRMAVVEHVLKNDDAARYVLARIGSTPDAFRMALAVAAHDSSTRVQLIGFVHQLEAAPKAHAK